MRRHVPWIAAVLFPLCVVSAVRSDHQLLADANRALFVQLRSVRGLDDGQIRRIEAIFESSGFIGQGNPAISEHPDTPEQCGAKRKRNGVSYANAQFERICQAKYMAPLYDPKTQKPEDARHSVHVSGRLGQGA